MLQIAIFENDEAGAAAVCESLARYALQRGGAAPQTTVFSSGDALVDAAQTRRFDVFLINVELDGIVLAERLRAACARGAVLFLADTERYAVQAFRVRARHYLMKPAFDTALFAALDEVRLAQGEHPVVYTQVKTVSGDISVALRSIVCVEVMGHVLHYYLTDGRVLASKVLRVSFEHAVAELTAPAGFLRPHQSYVVNAAHIERFSAKEIEMRNGMTVPVSRLRRKAIKQAYARICTEQ